MEGPVYVVGLMSGTSADGIDAVVAEVSSAPGQLPARTVSHQHLTFESQLRQRILSVCLEGSVSEICSLNFELGEHFAAAALEVIQSAKLAPENIVAIGSHGQTIHHLPKDRYPSTLQIGEPAVIAERTGITTVANFRVRDMAAGGQGAPLVPLADWALFTHAKITRIIQNIGGIANLTYLPPDGALKDVIAFDTGPGNMLMDGLVTLITDGRETFDEGGAMAARGHVSEQLLDELMRHPFIQQSPPKTTGREEFGRLFIDDLYATAMRQGLSSEDLVATATEFTAYGIEDAYRRFLEPRFQTGTPIQLIVGGGGAKNQVLMDALRRRLPEAHVLTHADFGVLNEAKEALAFALLAWQTMQGLPGNVPGATGASKPVILGTITPGAKVQPWPVTFSASSSAG